MNLTGGERLIMSICEIGLIPGYSECDKEAVDTIVWVDDDLYNLCAKHMEHFQ